MKKQQTDFNGGVFELTTLKDGKLVLGEYRGPRSNSHEIKKTMMRLGIKYGFLENNIGLIQSGTAGQIPVSQAYIEDEPGELKYHFKTSWEEDEALNLISSGPFDTINMAQQVCRNDLLVSLVKNPSTGIKFPDGRRELLYEHPDGDVQFYLGENVRLGRDINTIVSNIDGAVKRDIFGVVSVLPVMRVSSIGKGHGLVHYEKAMHVENDIRTGSNVQITGSLHVGGLIRSAEVEAAGSIHSNYGIDNPTQKDIGRVESGQSVYSSFIRNCRVTSSGFILIKGYIDKSRVQTLDTIAVPVIRSSVIRAGRRLYVNKIEPGCTIYLGPYFNKDTAYTEAKNFHNQHLKRLMDLENDITGTIERIRYEKGLALNQIKKLKKISPENIPNDTILNRYYRNLVSADTELASGIEKYEKQTDSLSQERMRLSFYERQYYGENTAEIICLGSVAAGTVITAPNQTLTLEEELENVTIIMESSSGELKIIPRN